MRKKRMGFYQAVVLILLILQALTVLTAFAEMPDTEENPLQVSMTFEHYVDQSGEAWFLTGKKEYSVEAMMVSKETSFHNDLEVADYTITDVHWLVSLYRNIQFSLTTFPTLYISWQIYEISYYLMTL